MRKNMFEVRHLFVNGIVMDKQSIGKQNKSKSTAAFGN